jgi:hypothetical protein
LSYTRDLDQVFLRRLRPPPPGAAERLARAAGITLLCWALARAARVAGAAATRRRGREARGEGAGAGARPLAWLRRRVRLPGLRMPRRGRGPVEAAGAALHAALAPIGPLISGPRAASDGGETGTADAGEGAAAAAGTDAAAAAAAGPQPGPLRRAGGAIGGGVVAAAGWVGRPVANLIRSRVIKTAQDEVADRLGAF